MARNYSSIAPEKTLSADVSAVSSTITLNNLTGLPSYPYALVINPDTVLEEIVVATSLLSGTTLNVTRAAEASTTAPGSTAKVHSQGNIVRHMITARDLQDSADHIAAIKNVHGISNVADNGVVGIKDTQTLANKTLTSPSITSPNITSPTISAGVGGSLTITSTEIGYLDGVTGNLQTQLDSKANSSGPSISNPTLSGTVTSTSGTIAFGTNASAITANGTTINATELGYLDGVTSPIQTQLNGNTPVGAIMMWTQLSPPTGWLVCNGQSTTGYTALATVVGATVPDLQGFVPVGYKSGDNAFGTLKGTGGSKTSTAAHTHGIDHDHAAFDTIGGEGAHAHSWSYYDASTNQGDGSNSGARWDNSSDSAESQYTLGTTTNGAHNHNINVPNFTGTSGDSSASATNGNLQPYFSLNFIIKT